jgi:hypothetical protein
VLSIRREDAFEEVLNIFILVAALYFLARTAESGMEFLSLQHSKEVEEKPHTKEGSVF